MIEMYSSQSFFKNAEKFSRFFHFRNYMSENQCHIVLREDYRLPQRKANGKVNSSAQNDRYLSIFQLGDRISLLKESMISGHVWSSAISDSIRSVASADDASVFAFASSSRCYVSVSEFDPKSGFFMLPATSSESRIQGSCVRFLPDLRTKIAIMLSRDFRVFETDQSSEKAIVTISGAAAQATPVSFAFVTGSPHLIATGWDLTPSPYVRMLDLREGTSKSIRIWKSLHVKGLSSPLCESNYLAGYCGSEVAVWDLRYSLSSGENMLVTKLDGKSNVESFEWSVAKRHTLAIHRENNEISFCRTDRQDYSYPIQAGGVRIGAFAFTRSNDLVIMDAMSGNLSLSETPKWVIPLRDPNIGCFESVTNTGVLERMEESGTSAQLLQEIQVIANRLEFESLKKAVRNSGLEKLIADTEFLISDDSTDHNDVLIRSFHAVFKDSEESDVREYETSNRKIYESSIRSRFISILLNEKEVRFLVPIFRFDFDTALRALLKEDDSDSDLYKSVARCVVDSFDGKIACNIRKSSKTVVSAISIVNSLFKIQSGDREFIFSLLQRKDLCIFARAAAALMYLDKNDALCVLENIYGNLDKTNPSLKYILFTGLEESEELVKNFLVGNSPLAVAIFGVIVKSPNLPLYLKKCMRFVRDQVCNRKGKNLWRLRWLIDNSLTENSPNSNGIGLICYYCQKQISGGRLADSLTETEPSSRCPHRGCHKPLPSCCVCLEPLTIPSERISLCNACSHGGHLTHMTNWFAQFEECPVAGCSCMCASIDGT